MSRMVALALGLVLTAAMFTARAAEQQQPPNAQTTAPPARAEHDRVARTVPIALRAGRSQGYRATPLRPMRSGILGAN
jgi:hypothetical protein